MGRRKYFAGFQELGRRLRKKCFYTWKIKWAPFPGWINSSPYNELETELIAALTGLGYSIVESQAAIQAIPKDTEHDIEAKLRAALNYFTR